MGLCRLHWAFRLSNRHSGSGLRLRRRWSGSSCGGLSVASFAWVFRLLHRPADSGLHRTWSLPTNVLDDGLPFPGCEVVAVCPHHPNAAHQSFLVGGVAARTTFSLDFFFPSSRLFLKVRSPLRLVPTRGGVLRNGWRRGITLRGLYDIQWLHGVCVKEGTNAYRWITYGHNPTKRSR